MADKPALMQWHRELEDVNGADYIFISHAHFEHLTGAGHLARRTGAKVIANCKAINLFRQAGVPETQLQPVSGGGKLPLFTRATRDTALKGDCALAPGAPGAPALPHPDPTALAVHVWPSLHCFMPGSSHADLPDIFDTGKEYHGSASPFAYVVVLGIAGRANLNGRPFNGSAAHFAALQLKWLGGPKKVIWCLHDEALVAPFRVDTTAATRTVENETGARVVELAYAKPYVVFE
ncbi:hypothetical protein BU25DRAFT_428085 [Macroventuria anomochaeta]|uniref:Uncharacterized protein n=1 Tax=Macroventuria anomochaeta TaxID=301207 RepID=A0ACB6SGF9_9PLEO|nr:uncharacterized protein BU25DRAFT_428085 [Macroventuria anomochaeta]KAF2632167.1 hypothetical protein BU25DRAFT_428085 [Macroventuria anomochaeta]